MAGFSFANCTYAFFMPCGVISVLTLSTFTLNVCSIAFFISVLDAFLSTTNTTLFSFCIKPITFSVEIGYLIIETPSQQPSSQPSFQQPVSQPSPKQVSFPV